MCSCTSKLALRVPRNDERGGPTREKQPDGQINNCLSIPLTKNISLSPSGKSALSARPSRAHKRGVSRSSRTWGAGCGGRDGIGARFERADERCYCVRRSRVGYILKVGERSSKTPQATKPFKTRGFRLTS